MASFEETIRILVKAGDKRALQEKLYAASKQELSTVEKPWLAHGYYALGQLEDAIAVLSSISTDDQFMIGVLYQRGIYLLEKHEYGLATKDFEKVIELEKEFEISYCSRSATYFLALGLLELDPFRAKKIIDSFDSIYSIYFDGGEIDKQELQRRLRRRLSR